MKLRTRIMLTTILCSVSAIFLFGYLIWVLSSKSLTDNISRYTRRECLNLTKSMETYRSYAMESEQTMVQNSILQYYFTRQADIPKDQVEYILLRGDTVLFNESGLMPWKYIYADEKISKNETISTLERIDGNLYCIATRSLILDKDSCQIYVIRDCKEITHDIHMLILYFALLGSMISLLLSLLIWRIVKRIFSPLDELSLGVAAISAGNYDKRVRVTTGDELGDLAQGFNHMAEAVEQHLNEVVRTAEAKDQLVHAITHELRTPVTAISGYADILETMSLSEEQIKEAVSFVKEESRRLERLSGRLIQLMGLEHEELVFQEIDPIAWKEQLQRIFGNMPEITLDFCDDVPIWGEQDLLTMLVSNLCDNARKAGATAILVSYRKGELSVKDNGIGILQENLTKIFQIFYQGDSSRNQEGFGLGLSLCQKIAEIHNSTLQVESEPEKGSRFYISFTRP